VGSQFTCELYALQALTPPECIAYKLTFKPRKTISIVRWKPRATCGDNWCIGRDSFRGTEEWESRQGSHRDSASWFGSLCFPRTRSQAPVWRLHLAHEIPVTCGTVRRNVLLLGYTACFAHSSILKKVVIRSSETSVHFYPTTRLYIQQEVLGRTNRLLSLKRHGPHWKRRVQQLFCCCVCIRYRGNVST
jgi:hypothetical protein